MTRTKGNIIVENIKIGDIHYEYDLGMGIKSKVISIPERDTNGNWVWQNQSLSDGRVITYAVNPEYPHYSSNLYDYEAYNVKTYI